MELITGNLFIMITLIGMVVFLIAYAGLVEDFQLERTFSFIREKQRKQQLVIGGKLVAGISVICYVIYAICYYVFKMENVPVWGLCLPVLFMLYAFFRFNTDVIRSDVKNGLVDIAFFVFSPSVVIFIVLVLKVKLDGYCGYASSVMLVANIWAAYKHKKAWREGDL